MNKTSNNSNNSTSSTHSSIPSGAIAGIVIGLVVLLVTVAFILYRCLYKHHNQRSRANTGPFKFITRLFGNRKGPQPVEAGSTEISEADGGISEIAGDTPKPTKNALIDAEKAGVHMPGPTELPADASFTPQLEGTPVASPSRRYEMEGSTPTTMSATVVGDTSSSLGIGTASSDTLAGWQPVEQRRTREVRGNPNSFEDTARNRNRHERTIVSDVLVSPLTPAQPARRVKNDDGQDHMGLGSIGFSTVPSREHRRS
jgi:hypothetical protein